MLDLRADHRRLVEDILARHASHLEVRAFGSRVTGRAKPHSDLDLAVLGDGTLSGVSLAGLEAAFADSDLPFRVDVLDWTALSPQFRRIVEEAYLVLQPADPLKRGDGP